MQDATLLPGMDAADNTADSTGRAEQAPTPAASPRLRRADRAQALMQPVFLDQMLDADHPARLISAVVGTLDLRGYYDAIKARGARPGRPATDPAMLITLWLYAATVNIGCGRELARRCQSQDAFRWICGGVTLCYKLITDFRVEHAKALDDLFTQMLVALVKSGVVSVECISQDGTKQRASAGSSSFHRQATTDKLLVEARAHVQRLKEELDPAVASGVKSRKQAAQARGAKEAVERLEQARVHVEEMQKQRDIWARGKEREERSRSSSTDPEARKMKMPGGGTMPAYNTQIASDPASRAIVGISVSSRGTDGGLDAPMREQIAGRLASLAGAAGTVIKEHLLDGGYASIESVTAAAKNDGVTLIVPPREREPGPGVDPVTGVKAGDAPAVVAWRERMALEASKEKYKLRGSTSELINGDLKTYRGMGPLTVRGIEKATCAVLWSAMAYNIMHLGRHLLEIASGPMG